jgi:hypothetical protein
MAAWPHIDERAVLTLACCGEQLATRVESTDGDQCVVHLPVHTCDQPNTSAADNVLSWFTQEQCSTRPVEIVGMGGYPRTALWILEAKGDVQSWQRRDYVRVHTQLPATAFTGDEPIAGLEAIDISEGGLRCVMATSALKSLPSLFNLRFELDGHQVRIAARVAWASPDPDNDGGQAVAGLEFQSIDREAADVIRAHVFVLQIMERRKQLVAH